MKPANEKLIEKWGKTREMGPQRYMWIYGALLWGVPTGVLWAIVMSTIQGWNRLPILLPIALIGFPIGGLFFGKMMWKKMESLFQHAQRESADGEASKT